MFLFFGITPRTRQLGFVMSYCNAHGGTARHELASYRSWFKLFFFLPLFPVGRERHLLTCTACGATYEVSAEQVHQLTGYAGPAVGEGYDNDSGTATPYPGTATAEPAPRIHVPSRRLDGRG
jgi:hypothetical protein